MKIKCLTTFLDGIVRYEKDDVRSVEDGLAKEFVSRGWAAPVEGTSLDIKKAVIGTGDSNG